MPRNDFYCTTCGHSVCDVITHKRSMKCNNYPCKGKLVIDFGAIRINRHLEAQASQGKGSMYGKYHNGFGCVVRDYAHKQELLKRYNVSEAADPVKGSRSWRDQVPDDPQTSSYDQAVDITEDQVKKLLDGDKQTVTDVSSKFEQE